VNRGELDKLLVEYPVAGTDDRYEEDVSEDVVAVLSGDSRKKDPLPELEACCLLRVAFIMEVGRKIDRLAFLR
jgi:hypothetical protein